MGVGFLYISHLYCCMCIWCVKTWICIFLYWFFNIISRKRLSGVLLLILHADI